MGIAPGTLPPPNAYTVSCIPWVTFSHFAVHSYDNKPNYFPSVEAGKVYAKGERMLMPLSLTCHHATTDGYHVHRFLEALGRISRSRRRCCCKWSTEKPPHEAKRAEVFCPEPGVSECNYFADLTAFSSATS